MTNMTEISESEGSDEVEAEKEVVPSKSSKHKPSKNGVLDISIAKSLSKSQESISKKQKSEKLNQKDEGASLKMTLASKKQPNKSSTNGLAKDEGTRKIKKKAKVEPGREEMHAVVDILKAKAEPGYTVGLTEAARKAELKDIINEVPNNIDRR